MSQMTAAFNTARLRVFEASVTPWEQTGPRLMFTAFFRDAGPMQTVAHALVWDLRTYPHPPFRLFCDLMEVSSFFRRIGIAKELYQGIETHLEARMEGVAVTPEGEALLRSLGREIDAFAPVLKEMQDMTDKVAAHNASNPQALEALKLLANFLGDAKRPAYEPYQSLVKITKIASGQQPK
jgi:hypothetical protein